MGSSPFILPLAVALLLAIPALAAEPVASFGSLQEERALAIPSSGTVTTSIWLFNAHGNRDSHIRLAARDVPAGWQVTIEPALHRAVYEVGGAQVAFEENMAVNASGLSTSPPPGGNVSIAGGYAPAKRATVRVTAPPGATGKFRVDATAYYLSQVGLTGYALARSFEFSAGGGNASGGAEVVSATLSNLPLNINRAEPGATAAAEVGQGFPMKLSIDAETTTATALRLAGTDFTSDGKHFPASSLSYSDSRDGARVKLGNDYGEPPFATWGAVSSGGERAIYFWASMPKGQPPGSYTNTLFVDLSPAAIVSRPPVAEVRPEVLPPTPTPTPTAAPTTTPLSRTPTRQPGFELPLALGALAAALLLRRKLPGG